MRLSSPAAYRAGGDSRIATSRCKKKSSRDSQSLGIVNENDSGAPLTSICQLSPYFDTHPFGLTRSDMWRLGGKRSQMSLTMSIAALPPVVLENSGGGVSTSSLP